MANETKKFGCVLYEREGNIATVTLNRPERRNALGDTLREDIVAAMGTACCDDSVRVVILTGAGTAFCSGGDVGELLDRAENGRPIEDKIAPQRDRTLLAIYECPKPVIAAVNGPAMGAGMNLALAADIRIASDTAIFSQSHVKRGMMPDYGGTYLLPLIVGYSKAYELIYTAITIDADEALRLGLVSQVVDSKLLLETAASLARTIAKNAPVPLRLAKIAVQLHSGDLRQALDRETAAQNVCYDSIDAQEGLKAFTEKREPVFIGS